MKVEVHLGVVWAYRLDANGAWFYKIKAFPEAVDKRGEPDVDHPAVLKYLKDA